MNGSAVALFIAVFLACAVEAVEATTIVLAAGTTRGWRSALEGVGAGLIVLAVLVGVLGPSISSIPLHYLRLVVGGLLLVFGLQWLRKAILRASGYKALHDEARIYLTQVAAAEAASSGRRGVVEDWYAFTLSFKGVVLEGLEVVFIALTFGSNQRDIPLAAVAAVAAVVVVCTAGFAVRAPLARVPENTLKFAVGVMLTSFGVFWGAEEPGPTGPVPTPASCGSCRRWPPTPWGWSPSSSASMKENRLDRPPPSGSHRWRDVDAGQNQGVRRLLVRLRHRRRLAGGGRCGRGLADHLGGEPIDGVRLVGHAGHGGPAPALQPVAGHDPEGDQVNQWASASWAYTSVA